MRLDWAEARRKKVGGNQKSEKRVCRYCGRPDLAPSFTFTCVPLSGASAIHPISERGPPA